MGKSKTPYHDLGRHLKYVREQAKQTLAEVSGAVEIDEQHLERIEAGLERPVEDVLMLLINYFNLKDREALQLWESADYDSDMPDEIRTDSESGKQPVLMLMAMDVRTLYSDGLDITVNPAGVTLNFTQANGSNQVQPVSRVGMSHAQAEMVVKTLQTALLQAKYSGNKLLPPGANK